MTNAKKSFGIIAITTLVLMVATTIGNAINTADAQRGVDNRDTQFINQNARQSQGNVDQRGLVNVGNTAIGANVAVPVQACVAALASGVNC
jgi:hypothetical protein